MTTQARGGAPDNVEIVHQPHASLRLAVPPGYVGPYKIPGTDRMVWWTGRVAIGLLHRPGRWEKPVGPPVRGRQF